MKKLFTLLFLPLTVLFYACSTDIDLYAEYEEKPIIYGLLDSYADTNFIKITRSFSVHSDAYLTAANPDSSDYPGKLDCSTLPNRWASTETERNTAIA